MWRKSCILHKDLSKKVKWSRYRPGVAQRVGRGIALLFHDRGTRRGWVVSVTPRPLFTPVKDRVPIVQEARWAPGPVRTGAKSRPHRDSIPDCPARRSVAIPTELPVPHKDLSTFMIRSFWILLWIIKFKAKSQEKIKAVLVKHFFQ